MSSWELRWMVFVFLLQWLMIIVPLCIFRSENTKTVESETNSVDRAIANLLFNKTGSVQESNGSARQCNYNLSLTQPPHYPQHTRLSSDALVPIFSTKEKPPAGGDCKFKKWLEESNDGSKELCKKVMSDPKQFVSLDSQQPFTLEFPEAQ